MCLLEGTFSLLFPPLAFKLADQQTEQTQKKNQLILDSEKEIYVCREKEKRKEEKNK